MSYREIELGFQVRHDKPAAKQVISDKYRQAKCNAVKTAELLDIGYRTLNRYIEMLGLAPALAKMKRQAKKEGWLDPFADRKKG